ncbi:MAG: cbb3-type cytochrome c oxidase subunit 3 [Phycisphaerales bacterium JB059]
MRLSDVIGHLDLAVFPIIGLVCFGAVFAGVVWRVFRADARDMKKAASMALADDATGDSSGGDR